MTRLQHDGTVQARTGCGGCGARDTLSIDMSVGKGGPQVSMTSCPRCERRQWTSADGTVARADLLQLLSGRSDFVFTPKIKGDRRRN